ncbi:MAG TPA: ferrochelatase [Methylomirabilota bacterium]|nr:ferrochelatase [Methylomirabilota bacterium]
MSRCDSVLLIAFGGPEKPEDIRPFLRNVAEGRGIPPERLEEVARHYEAIGGRSPLNELTRLQAEGLRRVLRRDGRFERVYIGMRNWRPYLDDALVEMKRNGHLRALGIILSSFQTEASWERYIADVAAARAKVGAGCPEVAFAGPWGDHPLFLEAMIDRARMALEEIPPERRSVAPLVFTAHSVPLAMSAESPYVSQVESAASAIAGRLGRGRCSVAYQSRGGSPREPWLEPDIAEVLRALGREGASDVVVAPIGFVCDHVEVLYDLDIEARQIARESGLTLHRALTANDHPAFIEMLGDLVRKGAAS